MFPQDWQLPECLNLVPPGSTFELKLFSYIEYISIFTTFKEQNYFITFLNVFVVV